MGCVFGKSGKPVERSHGGDGSKNEVSAAREAVASVSQNGGHRKVSNDEEVGEREEEARAAKPRRRSSRPNPRLSNLPKHVHGEQVAAGWPSWLSAVAGEAINGWTPRRADSFEKLDKVPGFFFP